MLEKGLPVYDCVSCDMQHPLDFEQFVGYVTVSTPESVTEDVAALA